MDWKRIPLAVLLCAVAAIAPPPAQAERTAGADGESDEPIVLEPRRLFAGNDGPPRPFILSKWDEMGEEERVPELSGPTAPFRDEVGVLENTESRVETLRSTSPLNITRRRRLTSRDMRGSTSTTAEPTVASDGRQMFVTCNWGAAVSHDAGRTFKFVNPFRALPGIPGQPFCCDQVALYVPNHDLFVWYLQYVGDAAKKTNTVRVAVLRGKDFKTNRWRVYSFTPKDFKGEGNEWFDYPALATSQEHLFVCTNVYRFVPKDKPSRSLVLRIPLSQLTQYSRLNYRYFSETKLLSFKPAVGAGKRMYLASHLTRNRLRVLTWNDGDADPKEWNATVQQWKRLFSGEAPRGGRPWLGRMDGRITAGWVAGPLVGFAWGASGDGSSSGRPYTHVRVALLDAEKPNIVRAQPHLFSPHFAYAYPAVAPTASNEIGIAVSFGGGLENPSKAVGQLAPPSRSHPRWEWHMKAAIHGKSTPEKNRWGDYMSIQPDPKSKWGWLAAGYVLDGGGRPEHTVLQLTWFELRRELDGWPWTFTDKGELEALRVLSESSTAQAKRAGVELQRKTVKKAKDD